MGVMTSLRLGVSSALGTFRRVQVDPSVTEGGALLGQQPYYRLLWQYYDNSAFENIAQWGPYKSQYRLYRQIRMLYNPTRRLCDFYATHVYPGLLIADPAQAPEGQQIAVPLAEDTTPALRAALSQVWTWSRWQTNKNVLCRYGAVTGNVLVEVMDDVDHGRVHLNIVWPSLVSYLDLDPTGVVLAYALQYPARDDDGNYYEYRKEVAEDAIRYYKNGLPFDYGQGAAYPNPYGCVPAVWIKHKDLGGDSGAPAIHGSLGKVDELNSLASHIHDQIHKVIGAPVVVWSDGGVGRLINQKDQQKGPPTNPYDTVDLDREGVLMLKGPVGGRVDSLAGQLQLHEALEYVNLLIGEIEQDHPEVVMYRQLREMSQVTGPAATRLMGDVITTVDEVASNYDEGCSRIFSLAVAIAGWRAGRGDWGELGAAQQVFTPFDLDAYHAGSMPVTILPRDLIQQSESERLEVEQLRDSVKAGVVPTLAANLRENISN